MKKLLLMTIAMVAYLNVRSQSVSADAIIGQWWDEDKIVKVEIYKKDLKYFGKLLWGTTMFDKNGRSVKDDKNPDENLRKRDLYGLVMLTDFSYEDGHWEGGKIYDASKGKTYTANMKMVKDKLVIKGYVGVPIFGRNTTWERVK